MARLPCCALPGVAQQVIQRGHDRRACFAADVDYFQCRQALGEVARRFGCALHAHVLMTNRVRLLISPAEAGALSRLMQTVGRRYVAGFNARCRRTGTLREGRFKAGLVECERYVLTCYRYIELNPVRAGMVRRPGEYRWSSHACTVHREYDAGIVPSPSYLAMARTDAERRAAYRALFSEDLGAEEREGIRAHTQQQRAWGSDRFRAQAEAMVRGSVEVRPRGRPCARAREE